MDLEQLIKQSKLELQPKISNQRKYLEIFFKRNLIDNYQEEIDYLQKVKQIIYVDLKKRVCILGYDKQGEIRCVHRLPVYTPNNFFSSEGEEIGIYISGENTKTLFITEAFTDSMHYKQLHTKQHKDISILAIGRSRLLEQVITHRMEQIAQYDKIIVSFDKNKKGDVKTKYLVASLQLLFPDKEIEVQTPKYKSWFIDLQEVSKLYTHIKQKELL